MAHPAALAMRVRDDYAAAGVPMLPVVRGEDETRRQIFLYSLVLFGATLLLVPVASMGPIYLVTAVGLGGSFVYRALRLWRDPSGAKAWALFKFSVPETSPDNVRSITLLSVASLVVEPMIEYRIVPARSTT